MAAKGRASPEKCELLDVGAWYEEAATLLETAAEVELASYMFDNSLVHSVLLKRLQSKTNFQLNVYVDREMLAGSVPRQQRSRLKSLRTAGATIYACSGVGRHGSYHGKACVINKRYLFSGNANFTEKSQSNVEFCYKMTGAVVADVLVELAKHRQKFPVWNGTD